MMKDLAALTLILALVSCVSMDSPGPEDHVIVYGSFRVDGLLLDQPIERILMIQVEPDPLQAASEPVMVGGMFFTAPLPVGGRWKIASVTAAGEELFVPGIEWSAREPGLVFLGSLELAADDPRHVEVRRREAPGEREHLQTLLDAWQQTPWAEVIRERIRSLDRDCKS